MKFHYSIDGKKKIKKQVEEKIFCIFFKMSLIFLDDFIIFLVKIMMAFFLCNFA